MFIYLFIHPYIYLSIYWFTYPFIHLYIIDYIVKLMNSTHPPAPVGAKKVCLWGGTNNRSAFSREWVQNTVSWGILGPLWLSPNFCSGRHSWHANVSFCLQFGPNLASCAILSPDQWQEELSQCLQRSGWITGWKFAQNHSRIYQCSACRSLQTQAFWAVRLWKLHNRTQHGNL